MFTALSSISVPSYLFFSPGLQYVQTSPVLQKSARSQILLHNSITLPLHGFSHIPILNIHYTKLPTEDFVRRKKERIIYDLLKFPSTSRIKRQHHSLLPFFQHQKKIRPSSCVRLQWIKSFPPTVGPWNTHHPSLIPSVFFPHLILANFYKCVNIFFTLQ